jgi:tRNA (guanine-N7-)-methyltransferase
MTTHYQSFWTKQRGPHPHLSTIVLRHAHTRFKRPIPTHQIDAFKKIMAFVGKTSQSLIIDSGCGTGLSSQRLAERFPKSLVIGIDKSLARLNRAMPSRFDNILLLRGDVVDLWRLIAQEKLTISHHFLFFPNPWPKESQIKRRFHAHPVFTTMVSLAPYFEMRTNWYTYAQECKLALQTLGHQPILIEKPDQDYMTLFEKKYLKACCPIYILMNTAITS